MRFFKYGIEVFDGKLTQYDGHWQFLSDYFRLDYLIICFNTGISEDLYNIIFLNSYTELFRRMSSYYDGYHHHVNFIIINVCWGGRPFVENF